LRICNAQVLIHIAKEPIKDAATIHLTLLSLEASSVFDFALDNWHLKDDATKTMDTFKEHFNKEDKECERKLTAKTGGFCGANTANCCRSPGPHHPGLGLPHTPLHQATL
jgi:hypothetical protein